MILLQVIYYADAEQVVWRVNALNKNIGLRDEMKYENSSVVISQYGTGSKEQMLLTGCSGRRLAMWPRIKCCWDLWVFRESSPEIISVLTALEKVPLYRWTNLRNKRVNENLHI